MTNRAGVAVDRCLTHASSGRCWRAAAEEPDQGGRAPRAAARQPPDSPEHVLVPGARLLREARLSALRRNIRLSAGREPAFLREAPIRPRRWGKTNRVEHGYVDKDCPESNA